MVKEIEDNKKLYWYGFWAKVKKGIGWLSIILGIIIGLISGSWIIFILGLVIGIFLIIEGSEERFDYKRQSGTILHQGDWN